MKILFAMLLVAFATPALAKKPQLNQQNQAIDKGMKEAGEKADIARDRKPPTNRPAGQNSGAKTRK